MSFKYVAKTSFKRRDRLLLVVTCEDVREPWLRYMLRAVEDIATWTTTTILHPKLMTLLTRDGNGFDPYFSDTSA